MSYQRRDEVDSLPISSAGPPFERDRGQALVEFVLVLPLLLVLIIGIIEFANAWRTSQMITNIAREGARIAVVPDSPDENGVRDSIEARITSAGLDLGRATIALNVCRNCSGTPDRVTLDYAYEFIFFGPVMNLMVSGSGDQYGSMTLSSTSVMRNE